MSCRGLLRRSRVKFIWRDEMDEDFDDMYLLDPLRIAITALCYRAWDRDPDLPEDIDQDIDKLVAEIREGHFDRE